MWAQRLLTRIFDASFSVLQRQSQFARARYLQARFEFFSG